ncbi:winged helix-turn-helix transcriptional regulator [Stappia sp. F7233]|uniref:Winged helix-turn-helix transcriptional regulator n=1 Tax=Stappia albiluteola TaxID=2758565 RepID=A0A839AKC5_9HYPH|nr:winged helix-turn-helix domain-containing protein [Stappia albiluteola]MBA5779516.1 winged helix-turn-helix transcriptional regulator [Stappia albiluteola]
MTTEPLTVDGPDADGVWLSIAAIARQKGVSKQAVSKRVARYVEDGLLETRRAGRETHVNLVVYDRLVGEMTDPAQELRNGGGGETLPAGDEGSYNKAKARRENYRAESERLDLEERIGNLVKRDEVEDRIFLLFRRVRDRLIGFPAIVAPRVAAAPDARSVRNILDEEMRSILQQASELVASQAEGEQGDED